jgi:hypothetical protein
VSRTTHIPQPVILRDIMAEVVANVATKFGSDVYFYFDVPEKIEARLLLKDQVNAIKYPAVLFFCDIPETIGVDYYAAVTFPKVVIATYNGDVNSFSDSRYDKSFRPVLYPIYEWFKKCCALHKNIVLTSGDNLTATKWDRLYWGSKPAGKALADYLDAIELQNLKLTFQQNC